MSIRCVLFDIGGVLLTLGEMGLRRDIAQKFGLSDVPETYNRYVPAVQRGELSETAVWSVLVGRDVDCAFFEDVFVKHFPLREAMLAFARDLRERDVTTAILSNTERTHANAMRRMGFLSHFDRVFLSHEIGYRKPEEGAFHHVLKELGLGAEQVVYIDDVEAYVQAAINLGIRAVWHRGDDEQTQEEVLRILDEHQLS